MLEFKLIGFLVLAIYLVYFIKTYKKKNLLRNIFEASFLIYICFVIKLTIFPIPILQSSIEINKDVNFLNHNFIPFRFLTEDLLSRGIVGNFALLFPLGIYLALISRKMNKISKVLVIAFLVSLIIELIQLSISIIVGYTYRSFNIDDIILNVTGALLGYLVLQLFIYTSKKLLQVDIHDLLKSKVKNMGG